MDVDNQGQILSREGQWQKIKSLSKEVISKIESLLKANHFSLEVRDCISEWIETQPWSSIADENDARNSLNQMITEISRCSQNQPFPTQWRLEGTITELKTNYGNSALEFTMTMENILTIEHILLKEHKEKDVYNQNDQLNQSMDLTEQLQVLVTHSQKIQEEIMEAKHQYSGPMALDTRNIEPDQKKLQIRKGQDSNAVEAENRKLKVDQILKKLHTMGLWIGHKTGKILDEELQKWKSNQRLDKDPNLNNDIDKIQKWYSKTSFLINESTNQINEISRFQPIEQSTCFTQILHELCMRSFLVLEQPPQVLKVGNNMGASVCLLCADAMNFDSKPPIVTAELILYNGNRIPDETKWTLNNKTSAMKYEGKKYIARFKKLNLRDFKRTLPPGKSVTEEKYALKFSMKIPGDEEKILQVLSLPVVIISNVSQESKAEGTILWDNFLTDHIPEGENSVPWTLFTDMLDYKFKKEIGVHLKPENFEYFASKMFDGPITDLFTKSVSWDLFWKRSMTGVSFSFWDWFHAIIKLIQTYFLDMYKEGLVMGFVERVQSKRILLQKPEGTFLLRFSDHSLGGISIARRGKCSVIDQVPYTSEKLKNHPLAKLVQRQKELLFLCPDIPVKEAFKKYPMKKEKENQFMKNHGYTPVDINVVTCESSAELMETEHSNQGTSYDMSIADDSGIGSISNELPDQLFADVDFMESSPELSPRDS